METQMRLYKVKRLPWYDIAIFSANGFMALYMFPAWISLISAYVAGISMVITIDKIRQT